MQGGAAGLARTLVKDSPCPSRYNSLVMTWEGAGGGVAMSRLRAGGRADHAGKLTASWRGWLDGGQPRQLLQLLLPHACSSSSTACGTRPPTCWHFLASIWGSLKQRASCSTAPLSMP